MAQFSVEIMRLTGSVLRGNQHLFNKHRLKHAHKRLGVAGSLRCPLVAHISNELVTLLLEVRNGDHPLPGIRSFRRGLFARG